MMKINLRLKKWIPYNEEKEEKSTENREQEAFQSMMHSAKEDNEEELFKKVEKYKKTGMSEKEAKGKASKKLEEEYIKQAMDLYRLVIKYILQLENGPIHEKVMSGVKDLWTTATARIRLFKCP